MNREQIEKRLAEIFEELNIELTGVFSIWNAENADEPVIYDGRTISKKGVRTVLNYLKRD